MIQRIQSLYMLLAVVCQVIFCFVPIFSIGTNGGFESLFAFCFGKYTQIGMFFPMVFVLELLITIIIIIAIFKYKKRKQQRALCFVSRFLHFLAFVLLVVYNYQESTNFFRINCWCIALLIVVTALLALSSHAIWKDEELIRSADRIR